ncbi:MULTISPECIES: hypothetical protein [Edwardsiella]|uniref:Uncharacterized protein n=2 Tax=Edwardsiella anguillarum TaxID=1821960 RepID=A0A076LP97_9GAMM|nr:MULTISPECIES: hypothetical protein [Edwardsiella]AKM48178.1 hypothetical protein QY76_13370 [Edwardsiella sp. EA181011]GAJ66606.1 hypothetical protein MA13_contig00002-0317 [Edwardsiella piscicida]AIJ09706.1 Hypothetical protein ETEE_3282 [Edwardsiella anguillarum ET080813]AKR77429.1 hypothetical protein AAZ33_06785 [Edwardsiella sp. LADL05-105]KAB0592655.1 hypothetical protein F7P84_04760 [Edwardsiella anguillarum]
MKPLKSVVALCALLAAPAFAATQINTLDTTGYTKVAALSLEQMGLPNIGDSKVIKAVDSKCASHGVAAEQCYFRVLSIVGDASNHKNIFIEIYKK